MKLNDIVMASTQDTKIRVVVKLYGTSFRTEHFPEYFLESEEMDELMDREVVDIRDRQVGGHKHWQCEELTTGIDGMKRRYGKL